MTFEVEGEPLAAMRSIIKQSNLDPENLVRIRLEVESTKPVFDPTNAPEPTDPEESPDDEKHECVCGDSFSASDSLYGHQRHCEEYKNETGKTDPDDRTNGHTDDPIKLLSGTSNQAEIAEKYAENPEAEKWDSVFQEITLNPETVKWNVTGVIYRSQGRLGTGDIREILAGTDLESDSSTISQSLRELMDTGIVDRVETSGWPKYQLTQFGRDCMEYKIRNTGGYKMQAIDKAVGVSPA